MRNFGWMIAVSVIFSGGVAQAEICVQPDKVERAECLDRRAVHEAARDAEWAAFDALMNRGVDPANLCRQSDEAERETCTKDRDERWAAEDAASAARLQAARERTLAAMKAEDELNSQ